jgi:hypothetical protein
MNNIVLTRIMGDWELCELVGIKPPMNYILYSPYFDALFYVPFYLVDTDL